MASLTPGAPDGDVGFPARPTPRFRPGGALAAHVNEPGRDPEDTSMAARLTLGAIETLELGLVDIRLQADALTLTYQLRAAACAAGLPVDPSSSPVLVAGAVIQWLASRGVPGADARIMHVREAIEMLTGAATTVARGGMTPGSAMSHQWETGASLPPEFPHTGVGPMSPADSASFQAWRREWESWSQHMLDAIQRTGGVRAEQDRIAERVSSVQMRAFNASFESANALRAERAAIERELERLEVLPRLHDHDRRAQELVRRLKEAGVPEETWGPLYKEALALAQRIRQGGTPSSDVAEREWLSLEDEARQLGRRQRAQNMTRPLPQEAASTSSREEKSDSGDAPRAPGRRSGREGGGADDSPEEDSMSERSPPEDAPFRLNLDEDQRHLLLNEKRLGFGPGSGGRGGKMTVAHKAVRFLVALALGRTLPVLVASGLSDLRTALRVATKGELTITLDAGKYVLNHPVSVSERLAKHFGFGSGSRRR